MAQTKLHFTKIAETLNILPSQVKQTFELLDGGGTVPFIARYRKERTGSLDEVVISSIQHHLAQYEGIDKRRESIISSLRKQERLTDDLLDQLNRTDSLNELEDIYLPFRPKRKTRGAIARDKGLLPLAEALYRQTHDRLHFNTFIDETKGVCSQSDALGGALDIIAEMINEDQPSRQLLRDLFRRSAIARSIVIKKNEDKAAKFRDYFDWQEPVSRLPGHRILALFRGESEKFLRLSFQPDEKDGIRILERRHLKQSPNQASIRIAIDDCYKRLLAPSLENELRKTLKENADSEAIDVFSENLRELLLAPPLGLKRVLALDPGFRTGAKLVCLDEQGRLLTTTTIFPTHGKQQQDRAAKTIVDLVSRHEIEAIAIGNGTASRETEEFIRALRFKTTPLITLVNEDGASIYSASETARLEFPDEDITVRGAVSIGRRLQDPLAELVKLDPKSIGVGQYQHDVNQTALKNKLDEVVSSCVNSVGVELNSASVNLLTHVSGLGPVLAQNIIAWRNNNGPFKARQELLKVPRLGAKAYELAAGFLRIRNAANPLDNSGVHPEQYDLVGRMARDLDSDIEMLLKSPDLRASINPENYLSPTVGMPTLKDILAELDKPGRDPRERFHQFHFAEGVHQLEDLKPGMSVPGIITNVTTFGAFTDIGVHQDGLIHISQLADRYVKDPSEIVKVRQQVTVRILEIDLKRKRISLSLKSA